MSIELLISQTLARIDTIFNIRGFGEVTDSEFLVLELLQLSPGCSPGFISKTLSWRPAQTSRVLKSLEKKKFITSSVRSEDRRGFSIHSTKSGIDALDLCHKQRCSAIKEIVSGFSESLEFRDYEFCIKDTIDFVSKILDLSKV